MLAQSELFVQAHISPCVQEMLHRMTEFVSLNYYPGNLAIAYAPVFTEESDVDFNSLRGFANGALDDVEINV